MAWGHTQDKLSAYIRDQANWRDGKAQEHPEDARNARCAESLRGLADYVESLRDPDPAILTIDSMQSEYELDVFSPSEEGHRLIARYGFDSPTPDLPDEFLTKNAPAEARSVNEREQEGEG